MSIRKSTVPRTPATPRGTAAFMRPRPGRRRDAVAPAARLCAEARGRNRAPGPRHPGTRPRRRRRSPPPKCGDADRGRRVALHQQHTGDVAHDLVRLEDGEHRGQRRLEGDGQPEERRHLQRLARDADHGEDPERREHGRHRERELQRDRVREVALHEPPVAGHLADEDGVLAEVRQGREQRRVHRANVKTPKPSLPSSRAMTT